MSRVKVELTPETEAVKVVVTNDGWQEGDAPSEVLAYFLARALWMTPRKSRCGYPEVPQRRSANTAASLRSDRAECLPGMAFTLLLKERPPAA